MGNPSLLPEQQIDVCQLNSIKAFQGTVGTRARMVELTAEQVLSDIYIFNIILNLENDRSKTLSALRIWLGCLAV